MKAISLNMSLLLVLAISLMGLLIIEFGIVNNPQKKHARQMQEAVNLAQAWFDIIGAEKNNRGIVSDSKSNVKNAHLLGNDFTFTTTTLGSLNSKEISTNPEFAALVISLLKKSGISKKHKVGVVISGSFPALAVSTLAALQTLHVDVVLLSSLGASSFGANQPQATWIDMETWLAKSGGLKYSTSLLTLGGENDNGTGITADGVQLLQEAANRNNHPLFIPANLSHSISEKVKLFTSENISFLINIGGNQAAMGRCAHTMAIPNDLNTSVANCTDAERGIIRELNSRGIPFINFLNIKQLAGKYGIDISPGIQYAQSAKLYEEETGVNEKLLIIFVIVMSLLALFSLVNPAKKLKKDKVEK